MNRLTYFLKNRLILLILMPLSFLTIASSGIAQQSFGGTPLLIGEGTLRSATAGVSLAPDFNPQDLLNKQEWGTSRQRLPYHVGKVVPCTIDFASAADLIGSTGDMDIYRLEIEMEQSPVGLNLYYSDFYIPQGGQLYIYTPGGEQLLGAYTHETHPRHGAFASEPLSGSKLILDYEAPRGTTMPSIQISGVGYFYRAAFMAQPRKAGAGIEKEDASDPAKDKYCQLNINCPEGAEWQEQKSSSVIYAPVFLNGHITLCSGNLVNNVAGDFKPYVLTAAHCAGEENSKSGNPSVGSFEGKFPIPQETMDQWVFGFHYEKPRCNNSDYGFQTTKSLVGATLRTYTSPYGYSDGMLLELKADIPLDYRVYYAGWDATEKTWKSGAGIHHPAGDATKLSLYNKGMTISQWVEGSFFAPTTKGGENDQYSLMFHTGNTEGGSSGSPLYNENKMQIATLTGGIITPCAMDGMYGRLSSHFNKYSKKGDLYHMDMYLDPESTGTMQVEGSWRKGYKPFSPVHELRGKLDAKNRLKAVLEWDALPAHAQGYPISYQLYRNGVALQKLTETKYIDELTHDLTEPGYVSYAVEALYEVEGKQIATPAAYRSVYTGKLVHEVKPTIKSNETAGVSVTWGAPVNTQIVSKIADRKTMKAIKASTSKYGKWLSNNGLREMQFFDKFRLGRSPFDKPLYVHQINVLPVVNRGLQRLYLRQKVQGSREYSQYYTSPTKETGEWLSIPLKTPFELHMEENLEVGFKMQTSAPHDLFIDGNSKDEYMGIDGGFIAFPYDGNTQYYTLDELYTTQGYLALELVVSDSPTLSGDTIRESFTRGPLPVPFPEVKGYAIYRNDEKIGEVDPAIRSYSDASGMESANYRIEVLYNAPEGLAIDKISTTVTKPYLYPSVIHDVATLTEADEVLSLQLFDLSGRTLLTLQGEALRSAIDLTSLAEGTYVALIRTAQETLTQRVIIKRNQR